MAINATTGSYTPTDTVALYHDSYGGITHSLSGKVPGSYHYKKSVGEDIKDYHKKIRNGELLPVTNWTQYEITNNVGISINDTRRIVNGVHNGSGTLLNDVFYDAAHTVPYRGLGHHDILTPEALDSFIDVNRFGPNVVDRAVIKLTVAKHDTLTSIAELGKTVNLFRNAGKSLGKLLQDNSPKRWADLWLEGRYGWRTLQYELDSVENALRHIDKSSPFWRAVVGSFEDVNYNHESTYKTFNTDYTYKSLVQGNVSYRGIAVGQRKPPSFGFNIPKTAWELVPFSFVVDWFVNVGDTIDLFAGHMATQGQYVSGLGVQADLSLQYDLSNKIPTPTSSNWYNWNSSYSSTATGSVTKRLPFAVTFTPQLNVNLDAYKVADLTALVVQQISKPRRGRR